MARLLGMLTATFLLTWVTAPARADGLYGGLGAGGNVGVDGELGDYFSGDGHAAGRFVGGKRIGPWAIEASLFGTDLHDTVEQTYSTLSLGVDAKLHVPVGLSLEVYLRAGLNHTWLSSLQSGAALDDYAGRGVAYGTGIQWKSPNLRLVQFAAWLDFTQQKVRLHREGAPSLDGKIGMVTVGFFIGRSF